MTDKNAPAGRRTEIVAGVTTFLAMSYIAVVNPSILSTEGTGLPFSAVMTATVVVAAVSSILMGIVARLPYGLAPGMGMNAFVTYTLVLGEGMTGPQALGAVFLSGAVFTALSATPARQAIARALPGPLRHAIAGGIGLFLVVIGLRNANIVVDHPVTLVAPGPLGVELGLTAAGLLLIVWLLRLEVRGALLIGMLATTLASLAAGVASLPPELLAAPDFSLFGALSFEGLARPALIGPILTLLLTDLFDSLSTFVGVSQAAGLVDDDGEPIRLGRALFVDAIASTISGLAGTSPATTYVESASGVREGGRTGLTAIVVGLCFLPLLFAAPLAGMIPPHATAPVLIVVGFFMLGSIRQLPMDDLCDTVPAMLTLVLIPMTFSITQGIVWGILSFVVLRALTGRVSEVRPTLWVVAGLCAVVLAAS